MAVVQGEGGLRRGEFVRGGEFSEYKPCGREVFPEVSCMQRRRVCQPCMAWSDSDPWQPVPGPAGDAAWPRRAHARPAACPPAPVADDAATKPRQLCFVAFLPHILDAGVEGRSADIQVRAGESCLPFTSACIAGGDACRPVSHAPPVERLPPTPAACGCGSGVEDSRRLRCSWSMPPHPPATAPLNPNQAPPNHVQILKDLADKFKDRPFSFSWSEGGAQPELEANFGVG